MHNLQEMRKREAEIRLEASATAVSVANAMLERVPAYRDFLRDHDWSGEKIERYEDFLTLPLSDKKNYITAYDFTRRCLDGGLEGKHLIFSSSGSSGEPCYWTIVPEDEESMPETFNTLLELSLDYRRHRCLIVLCLGLGAWMSGLQTHWALRQAGIMNRGSFSLVSPGADVETAVRCIRDLAPSFDTLFLISYPGLTRVIIDRGKDAGIDWRRYRMRLGLVGDNYSEGWRSWMEDTLGIDKSDPLTIFGGYGGADMGGVGIESPLSIRVRRLAAEFPDLRRKLFGCDRMPFFCRSDPRAIFTEIINGELVFTRLKGVPLARYSIGDQGDVIACSDLLALLEEEGLDRDLPLDLENRLYPEPLPFVYTFGKANENLTLYGGNIYAAYLREIFSGPEWNDRVTGRFRMHKKLDAQFRERFHLLLELASGVEMPSSGVVSEWAREIQKQLMEISSEYQALCRDDESRHLLAPVLDLRPFGDPALESGNRYKTIYIDKG
jgi:phenylacetate-CoA ligase